MDPLTVTQNTTEWFLLRSFSCTSSTTDQLLNAMKKIYLDTKTHNLISEVIAASLKLVLDTVQGPSWDENVPTHKSPQSQPTPAIDATGDILPPEFEDGWANSDIVSNIKLLTSGTMSTVEFELKEQIVNNTLR